MPGGLSGYQLAVQARAEFPQLKVLLTSGYTYNSGQNKQIESENLLRKPYSSAELSRWMKMLVNESL